MTRRAGRLRVSLDLLHALFRLPDGARVVRITQSPEERRARVTSLILEGPLMPEYVSGQPMREIEAVYEGDARIAGRLVELRGRDT